MRKIIFILTILLIPFLTTVFVNNGAVAEDSVTAMIIIPGGDFKSGSVGKIRNVETFYIDKYEVTNAQFQKIHKDLDFPKGKENHPVVEVSYADAEEYCKSVGKRVPTSLEWEKAARGTDGRIYPWGNTFDPKKANTLESNKNDTVAVGSFPGGKSPYGVMDISGNVWEWVDGWKSKDKMYRLVMGGSFFENEDKNTTFSTLSSIEDDVHTYIGFRCAKNKQ